MKYLLPFFALSVLLFTSGCSQNDNKKVEPTSKSQPKPAVVKTAAHVQIPNSHLYIIPPAGFAVNETAGTLRRGEEYANIIVMKIISGYTPEKYFAELKAEADKNFPGSWKQEDIIADGHNATLYQYKNAAIQQYYLAFTDGYTDEMIVASFEESEGSTGKQMYDAMKTVVVEKE